MTFMVKTSYLTFVLCLVLTCKLDELNQSEPTFTSTKCGNKGISYKSRCYCLVPLTGNSCKEKLTSEILNLLNNQKKRDDCKYLMRRKGYLLNFSPKTYEGKDQFFPANKSSIGKLADEEEGEKIVERHSNWTKIHSLVKDFSIFGKSLK